MSELVEIDYTNYRGERRKRVIAPDTLYFGSEWHPNQWVVFARDVEKNEYREFALSNIHSWTEVK